MGELLILLHAAVTTQKMAGEVIVSTLWRLNIYGEIVVWCYRASKILVFHHANLPQMEYKNPAFCN